ncbi:MAG: hypothetical protein HOD58_08860, partial [Gammaproteobacteria bacterium]|nr:hypothetical protein [Gammaproteobacteria bacterium]
MNIGAIFSDLRDSTPGFYPRPQQIALAKRVAEIAERSIQETPDHVLLAVEAPTGVGKTLGYLVGSIAAIESEQHKLVISTATTNLQDQIINRDLPLLFEQSGNRISYALAKGRGRFVCNMRLTELVDVDQQLEMDVDSSYRSRASYGDMLHQLTDNRWSGDLDHWPEQLSVDQLGLITNTREGCTGKRCNHYNSCSFYKMCKEVKSADIVVTNHALLLQDLVLGGGVILPPPENTFYVVDEAHRLHASARNALSGASDLAGLNKLGEYVAQLLNKLSSVSPSTKQLSFAEINKQLREVTCVAETLEGELNSNGRLLHAYQCQQLEHRLPAGHPWRITLQVHARGLVSLLTSQYKLLDKVSTLLQEDFDTRNITENMFNRFMSMIGTALNEINHHWQCWDLFMQHESDSEPPIARWISLKEANQGLHIVLNCTPISVAESLRSLFWQQAAGIVLTSATLRTLGTFDLLNEQLGLEQHPHSQFEMLDSPFDYQRVTLEVPRMVHTPDMGKPFEKELIRRLGELVGLSEGTLVLFTARAMMDRVYAALSPTVRKITLVQGGDRTPEEMVRVHRERINRGEGSLLMGLNLFSEGVDLPGDLCTHLVITKLPFPYFSGAVDRMEAEWLESMGQHPFMARSL